MDYYILGTGCHVHMSGTLGPREKILVGEPFMLLYPTRISSPLENVFPTTAEDKVL